MKSVIIRKPGAIEALEIIETPKPDCGESQVLVRVEYCGCNWADTQVRRGIYPHPIQYPTVPGFEISGTVAAVGGSVRGLTVGQRVAGLVPQGGYAEFCLADPAGLWAVPDAMKLELAAAFQVQALTTYHMLHSVYALKAGDAVLVHAIGGGVGLYVTQLGVLAGARIIGTVGSDGKADRPLRYGASYVIDRRKEDFVGRVMALTEGRGVDLAIDSLGGATLDRTFDCVRYLGHIINIGEAEATPFQNIRERLLPRSLTFTRFHAGHVLLYPDLWRKGIDSVIQGIMSGRIDVPIVEVYPLEKVRQMHRRLEQRGVSGKLLMSTR